MAGDVVRGILWVVLGTLIGCYVPDSWIPFIKLIHNFTSYSNIYGYLLTTYSDDESKNKKSSWIWRNYTFFRDYFLISSFRGIVTEAIDSAVLGNLGQFNLQKAIMVNDGYLKEAALSLFVCIGFEDFILCQAGINLLSITSIIARVLRSLEILKAHSSSTSATMLLEMAKLNVLNSASTTFTLTIIDIFLKGDLKILSQWIGVRLIYFMTPYIQVQYGPLGLAKLHSQIATIIQTSTKGFGLNFSEKLEDGLFVGTLILFLSSGLVIAPMVKSLLKGFV